MGGEIDGFAHIMNPNPMKKPSTRLCMKSPRRMPEQTRIGRPGSTAATCGDTCHIARHTWRRVWWLRAEGLAWKWRFERRAGAWEVREAGGREVREAVGAWEVVERL